MGSFRLGTVLGFEVRIDSSWFIIFFLFLWTFGSGVFPAAFPGLAPYAHWLMGLAAALLFFSSLLAHELSHSVVARAKGIPVRGITLFIFGGIAMTAMEAETPGDEFQIAGAGPLASVLIGALFLGVGWIAESMGWGRPVTGVAIYLAQLNIILAVFNLLPGFPLDGGRLFRAVVWKATGSLRKATRWAVAAGKGIGWLLIALGAYEAFQGAMLNGLWLVFIGWFLRNAAKASAPPPPGAPDPAATAVDEPPLGREVGRQ